MVNVSGTWLGRGLGSINIEHCRSSMLSNDVDQTPITQSTTPVQRRSHGRKGAAGRGAKLRRTSGAKEQGESSQRAKHVSECE